MEADPRVQKQQRQAALAILLRVIERQPTGKKMDADDIRSQLRSAQLAIVSSFPPVMGNALRLAKKAGVIKHLEYSTAARESSHGRLMHVWERT